MATVKGGIAIAVVTIIYGALCFGSGYLYGTRSKMSHEPTRGEIDTTKSVAPKPIDSIQTGIIKLPIRVSAPDEPVLPRATIKVLTPEALDSALKGRTRNDSDTLWVELPKIQKEYKDSTFEAWVSGYQPRLDSIKVYRRTIIISKIQTVTKRNAFGLGIIGGTGYGIFSRKPDIFVGIGGYIRLW
jgi:hypothetical protein